MLLFGSSKSKDSQYDQHLMLIVAGDLSIAVDLLTAFIPDIAFPLLFQSSHAQSKIICTY